MEVLMQQSTRITSASTWHLKVNNSSCKACMLLDTRLGLSSNPLPSSTFVLVKHRILSSHYTARTRCIHKLNYWSVEVQTKHHNYSQDALLFSVIKLLQPICRSLRQDTHCFTAPKIIIKSMNYNIYLYGHMHNEESFVCFYILDTNTLSL